MILTTLENRCNRQSSLFYFGVKKGAFYVSFFLGVGLFRLEVVFSSPCQSFTGEGIPIQSLRKNSIVSFYINS